MQWLMCEECAQTNAWISVVFYPTSTKSSVNTVEWSMVNGVNANFLNFRYRITALIVCCLARKMVQISKFFGPHLLSGTLLRNRYRKLVLLGTKSRRVEKFRGCRFSDIWESAVRKKKKKNKFVKYRPNGLHALAMLDRATTDHHNSDSHRVRILG